jgi:hypothetical protein
MLIYFTYILFVYNGLEEFLLHFIQISSLRNDSNDTCYFKFLKLKISNFLFKILFKLVVGLYIISEILNFWNLDLRYPNDFKNNIAGKKLLMRYL